MWKNLQIEDPKLWQQISKYTVVCSTMCVLVFSGFALRDILPGSAVLGTAVEYNCDPIVYERGDGTVRWIVAGDCESHLLVSREIPSLDIAEAIKGSRSTVSGEFDLDLREAGFSSGETLYVYVWSDGKVYGVDGVAPLVVRL